MQTHPMGKASILRDITLKILVFVSKLRVLDNHTNCDDQNLMCITICRMWKRTECVLDEMHVFFNIEDCCSNMMQRSKLIDFLAMFAIDLFSAMKVFSIDNAIIQQKRNDSDMLWNIEGLSNR